MTKTAVRVRIQKAPFGRRPTDSPNRVLEDTVVLLLDLSQGFLHLRAVPDMYYQSGKGNSFAAEEGDGLPV